MLIMAYIRQHLRQISRAFGFLSKTSPNNTMIVEKGVPQKKFPRRPMSIKLDAEKETAKDWNGLKCWWHDFDCNGEGGNENVML